MKTQKRYMSWKTNSNLDPIEGTDRVLKGSNIKSILRYLAHEEGVSYKEGDIMVKCDNGDRWAVRYIGRCRPI